VHSADFNYNRTVTYFAFHGDLCPQVGSDREMKLK